MLYILAMRHALTRLGYTLIFLPSLAYANPYEFNSRFIIQDPPASPQDPSVQDPSLQPTSSKAPASSVQIEEPKEEPVAEPLPPEPEPVVEQPPKLEEADHKTTFHRHGIGVRGGISIIPTWILNDYVAAHTNSLCRGEFFPDEVTKGLLRADGCNFYIGGEYIYRFSKALDIVPAIAYHQVKAPTGIWLDKDECPNGELSAECALSAGDYTAIDLSFLALQVDFIGRGTIVETPDFAFQLGGGGGLGLGIFVGKGVRQVPIGSPAGSPQNGGDQINTETCSNPGDYLDFRRCTPHWWSEDDEENAVPKPPSGALSLDTEMPNSQRFAKCTQNECDENDLKALGFRKNKDVPPVIPVVNLLLTMRFIIKDAFGINITGGWNTGFYFGGSLQYFFGPKR